MPEAPLKPLLDPSSTCDTMIQMTRQTTAHTPIESLPWSSWSDFSPDAGKAPRSGRATGSAGSSVAVKELAWNHAACGWKSETVTWDQYSPNRRRRRRCRCYCSSDDASCVCDRPAVVRSTGVSYPWRESGRSHDVVDGQVVVSGTSQDCTSEHDHHDRDDGDERGHHGAGRRR